jgi:cobalt/nickel transport system permease protein
MHMADALVSPAVGGAMWAVSAGLIACSSKKISRDGLNSRTALMGVLGAFVFAAQMINFTIPATGSSGHLGGGLILSILVGPYAGFIVMASILTVQALIFGDGGLLALGCNIFNLGFWTCFVAYPLIYKKIAGDNPTQGKIITGSLLAAITGLQLGAFSVVLETMSSGVSDLPFKSFILLMQPIHLAIGIAEGIVTAAVVIFVWKAKPEVMSQGAGLKIQTPIKGLVIAIGIATILTAGILAWFASSSPDGLEWAMFHTLGKEELQPPQDKIHETLASLQGKTAILPDYDFRKNPASTESETKEVSASCPAIMAGKSFAGIIGSILTLAIVFIIGAFLRRTSWQALKKR